MRFDILTLFPECFNAILGESIIGRAQEKGLIEINTINIRDFSTDSHKNVDDYPYGGGSGMVMMVQPVIDAYNSIIEKLDYKPHVIYLTPQGKVFNQQKAIMLKDEKHIVLLCGHYEGIDERIIEMIVDSEISMGDYVLTGGEIPAMALVDCISRMIPGVLSEEECYINESLYNGLLEYPQYTRPQAYKGLGVPEILLSGHHENIRKWRLEESLKRTEKKRPDLYEKHKSKGAD
ncbi:MAG: tRNA (guanosine(37)-N1)-methyltransferase TrmD [Clostridia bacterium]|jgi:tRNA (guanine37-N1)-methyltransferase